MKFSTQSLLTLAAALVLSSTAGADPHSEGTELGKSNLSKLSSNVTSSNAKAMPFYTDTPSQSSQFGSTSLFNVGTARINSCKTEPDGTDQIANQECDAVNFLAKNPYERVKVDVDENDPIISGIGEIINNAKPGDITENCGTKTTTTPDIYSTEVCNIYNLSEEKYCSMGQVVDVDAKANFQCNVTHNAVERVACDKYLTMVCEPPIVGCDNGGIVPGSTQADMYTSWTLANSNGTYALQFGSIGDNYWKAGMYDRSLEFKVKDPNQLSEFVLASISFDDYIIIKLNGNFIYSGPVGGTSLEIVNGKVDVGDGVLRRLDLERNNTVKPNINLVPYLVSGTNRLETRTAVGGTGETYITINARMLCNGPCTEKWTDQCSALNARL
ncbi:hypothetical protein LU640_26860 [Pseudomonas monteilii]|uniref:hypothetical protein n=1 Tax=Pseudomonas monteilii TaxID=76759 RepID=UPI001E3BEB6C|nr:hypothetical protein [Pseudomonas monteilii]MCE1021185.1 hypothetical protein [Pseudomonas monteilii]MCE1038565.1 hypothetical protein [Pseudomonas monteilii]MCE1090245.1 hypothetical protein [Pseudomonas monteilii]